MIFPYGDTNIRGGAFPIVNYALIGINILVFAYQLSLPHGALEEFIYSFGYVPAGGLLQRSALTSEFLHGGWLHLIGNMVFLYLFGDNIEQTIGRRRYLIFYLVGGLFATLGHYFSDPGSTIPAIGASGAIAAVMGAYLVCFPHSQIRMLFLIFPFRISAFLFLGFWIFQQFMSGTASLGVPTEDTSGVAWWAHIGGFIFGALCGLFFRRYKRPEPPIQVANAWKPYRFQNH